MQTYLLVRIVCADVHNEDRMLAAAHVCLEISSAIDESAEACSRRVELGLLMRKDLQL
jgi:hypothetical protein